MTNRVCIDSGPVQTLLQHHMLTHVSLAALPRLPLPSRVLPPLPVLPRPSSFLSSSLPHFLTSSRRYKVNHQVVLTKSDKLGPTALATVVEETRVALCAREAASRKRGVECSMLHPEFHVVRGGVCV